MANYIEQLLGMSSKSTSTADPGANTLNTTRTTEGVKPDTSTDSSQVKLLEEQEQHTASNSDPLSGSTHPRPSEHIKNLPTAGAVQPFRHEFVPNCPHCGRVNDYGYTTCDPVHPRMCERNDDGKILS